jgi:hypothetical protein
MPVPKAESIFQQNQGLAKSTAVMAKEIEKILSGIFCA